MIIELEIPLPPKGCAQNDHTHWRVRAKANQTHKHECFNVGMEARLRVGTLQSPVRIHHDWYMARNPLEGARGCPRRYRPLDEGNAIGALKAAIDGLVDCELLVADSHKHVKWGDGRLYRTEKDHKGRSCVVLKLEVMEVLK